MVKSSKSAATKSRASNKSKSRARSRSSGERSRSRGRSRSKSNDRRSSASSRSSSASRGSRREEKPKQKRPVNAYAMYIKEKMSNRKFAKGQAMEEIKNLAKQWKSMSDDEKKKYKGMADEANRSSGSSQTKK